MALTYHNWNANIIDVSAAQIDTDDLNSTDSFTSSLGEISPYQNFSIQCVWSAIVGVQPAFKLQATVDGTNWEDIPGANHVTTGASGSVTFNLSNFVTNQIRATITTASTSGKLDVRLLANGADGKGRLKR